VTADNQAVLAELRAIRELLTALLAAQKRMPFHETVGAYMRPAERPIIPSDATRDWS